MRNRHAAIRNSLRQDHEIPYPAEKSCCRCQQVKPAADFPKARRETDGLKAYCKECGKADRADWYRHNADREKAKVVAYQKENPDKAKMWQKKAQENGRAKFNAKKAQRYQNKKEEIRSSIRLKYASDNTFRSAIINDRIKHYWVDPEKGRQKSAAWRRANPDKRRAFSNAYRARKVSAPGECSGDDWIAILNYHNGRCAYCLRCEAEAGTLAMEHMLPLSRGGTNDPDNIVPGCKSCNSSKNDKTPLEFVSGLRPRRSA